MKLHKFLLLLALPLFFAGCSEFLGENTPANNDVKLTLTSEATLNFEAEGGKGTITYTLTNAAEDDIATAACAADWITNLTAGRSITFDVLANKGEARNTIIAVTYKHKYFEVTVNQAANENPNDEPNDDPEDPEDATFVATYLDGGYYAQYFGSVGYNYYLILSDLGFDEYSEPLANGKYYYLDVYSTIAVIDEDNYTTIPAGTYTYDVNDTTEVGTIAYASGYMVFNDEGSDAISNDYFENATLVVTESGLTLNAVVNGVTHVVTYKGAPKLYVEYTGDEDDDEDLSGNITDANFTALDAYAEYYGDEYTPGTADNYLLMLSDFGFDEDGYEYAGGTYYWFDLYAPITSDVSITPGRYNLDYNGSCAPWTVDVSSYTKYYMVDEWGYDYIALDYPDSGYIDINEDGTIYAEVHLANSGATHKISYDGDIYIYDDTDDGGDYGEDILTTLTGEYTCTFDHHTLYYTSYGDFYEIGLENFVLALIPDDYDGDIVEFDVLTESADFAGEYYISDSMEANTAYPGCLEYGYYMAGSWFYTGDEVDYATLIDGDIEIIKNSNGTYTLTFVACDELGNDIDGTWTGYAEENIDYYAASEAKKLSKSLVVEQKAVAPKTSKKHSAKQSVKRPTLVKEIKLR